MDEKMSVGFIFLRTTNAKEIWDAKKNMYANGKNIS